MNTVPVKERLTRRWPWRLAILFVLVTLVLLVIVPYMVQQRVNSLRDLIRQSEPARTLVMQWQLDLTREIVALDELMLTGDRTQIGVYETALADEVRIRERLGPMTEALGPHVYSKFVEARVLAEQWHGQVVPDTTMPQFGGSAAPAGDRAYPLFDRVLQSVADVDEAILQYTEHVRQDIEAAERVGLIVTVVLGFLALVAAAAVVAIEARIRSLAAAAERQRIEADQALAEAERLSDARTRLLRGITHDVKNPLGAAKGYAELLGMQIKGPLTQEQVPLVEGVERSVDSALAIIADLLDLARADAKVLVRREELDLAKLVRRAVDDYRPTAAHAGHEIRAEAAEAAFVVHTDPVRVRQILDNLVSNAIKYTPPPGRIVVCASAQHDPAPSRPGEWVAVAVSDTGPGIPPEHREAVFDEFSRLHDATPIQGHGLGLPTARALARQLGGELTLEESDQGATFALWIPQRDEAAAPGARDRRTHREGVTS